MNQISEELVGKVLDNPASPPRSIQHLAYRARRRKHRSQFATVCAVSLIGAAATPSILNLDTSQRVEVVGAATLSETPLESASGTSIPDEERRATSEVSPTPPVANEHEDSESGASSGSATPVDSPSSPAPPLIGNLEVGTVPAERSEMQSRPTPQPQPEAVLVPDVLGLTEADAVAVLSAIGLTVNVEVVNWDHDPRGVVVEAAPTAGTNVGFGATVTITIVELLPSLDVQRARVRIAEIVQANPETFIGAVTTDTTTAATVTVMMGAGDHNKEIWHSEFDRATRGAIEVRIEQCDRTHQGLANVQRAVYQGAWFEPENRDRSFDARIDILGCAVSVAAGGLSESEIETLESTFGDVLIIRADRDPTLRSKRLDASE